MALQKATEKQTEPPYGSILTVIRNTSSSRKLPKNVYVLLAIGTKREEQHPHLKSGEIPIKLLILFSFSIPYHQSFFQLVLFRFIPMWVFATHISILALSNSLICEPTATVGL